MDRVSELTPLSGKLKEYWDQLEAAGVIGSTEAVEEKCPDCGGMGYYREEVPIEHPHFGKLLRCLNPDCAAAQEIAKRVLRSFALPDEYQKLTFTRWESEIPPDAKVGKMIAFHAARLFAMHPDHEVSGHEAARLAGYEIDGEDSVRNSLAFFGEPGVSKTGLVASIMNEISAKQRSKRIEIVYRRTSDLFIDLQGAFDDREQADAANEIGFTQRIQRYQQADLLVLDEWRMQKMTAPRLQWMEDIVRYRHGHRLPTLFTTNETPESIYAHWGDQTADVALEMAHWIEVKGTKLRRTRSVYREF